MAHLHLLVTIFLLAPILCLALPTSPKSSKATCGYQSCPATDAVKLNVHLVAHTHDDVGWLKTVDQYYYGANTNYQRAGVQYILDSVVDALQENADRRFIYVETAFFWKWWVEQTSEKQELVKDLINSGRLEIIGGAWTMNDEATATYQSTIDQFTWGLRKINDTFGECGRPRAVWQIDPFGHSREMASIFARMGYDGLFFARLDYQDKSNRLATKTPELVWEGSSNLGDSANLFTSALYNHYSAPGGFCFDVLCGDEPIIDNKDSPDYNVDQKVQDFLNFVRGQAQYYTNNHILVTMGDDFMYQDATMNFKNIDKLIKYVNAANTEVVAMYSSPTCYLNALNNAGNTYTTKQDDFFPYGSDPNSYWTGYFTSRPTTKYVERLGNNLLQVGKQLEAMTKLGQDGVSSLDSLREAMGVFQHHDALTGTEKQHVSNDYMRTMSIGLENAQNAANVALNQLLADGANVDFQHCLQLNVSKCEVTENEERFVVTVYNPLGHSVTHFVRVPVQPGTYTVQDPQGTQQTIQMVPVPQEVLSAPEREGSSAQYDLTFKADSLPPLGFRSYYVTKVSSDFGGVQPSSDLFIGDSTLQVTLDESSGLVKSITVGGTEMSVGQNLFYYEGADNGRSSGAYIFRPKGEAKPISDKATATVYKGDVVEEIHQTFSDWASQIVRIYKQENHVEFEWLVGSIPIDDNIGKEVVSRFSSDLATNGLFYTDSNARELLERKLNFRPTWDVQIAEPQSGNYYPVTSKILIRDTDKGQEIAVLNDRAQGGSSLSDGQLEIMVHRRLLHDDGFGVGEPLNETAYDKGLIARGRHYLMAGNINGDSPNLAAQERELAQKKLLSPWLFLAQGGASFEEWQGKYKMEYAGLKDSLPSNVHILTLEPWREQSLVLRLEHILEQNEDTELSKPVDVAYEDIFTAFTISSSQETSLAANQWLGDMNRFVWKTTSGKTENKTPSHNRDAKALTLNPMEIATYVIEVAKRT